MARYIDADAFVTDARTVCCAECNNRYRMNDGEWQEIYAIGDVPCRACDFGDMINWVDSYHNADVEEVRHGKWKFSFANNGWADWVCSECGYVENTDIHVKLDWGYCPNCGARMDKNRRP